jgi:hypothetical protein
VKGFGCRPCTAVRRIPAAGVRKPPGEETAIGEVWRWPRALWGFERGAWGLEVMIARLFGRIVDLSAYHWRVVEVCAGIERWRPAGRWRPAWPIRASAAMAGGNQRTRRAALWRCDFHRRGHEVSILIAAVGAVGR